MPNRSTISLNSDNFYGASGEGIAILAPWGEKTNLHNFVKPQHEKAAIIEGLKKRNKIFPQGNNTLEYGNGVFTKQYDHYNRLNKNVIYFNESNISKNTSFMELENFYYNIFSLADRNNINTLYIQPLGLEHGIDANTSVKALIDSLTYFKVQHPESSLNNLSISANSQNQLLDIQNYITSIQGVKEMPKTIRRIKNANPQNEKYKSHSDLKPEENSIKKDDKEKKDQDLSLSSIMPSILNRKSDIMGHLITLFSEISPDDIKDYACYYETKHAKEMFSSSQIKRTKTLMSLYGVYNAFFGGDFFDKKVDLEKKSEEVLRVSATYSFFSDLIGMQNPIFALFQLFALYEQLEIIIAALEQSIEKISAYLEPVIKFFKELFQYIGNEIDLLISKRIDENGIKVAKILSAAFAKTFSQDGFLSKEDITYVAKELRKIEGGEKIAKKFESNVYNKGYIIESLQNSYNGFNYIKSVYGTNAKINALHKLLSTKLTKVNEIIKPENMYYRNSNVSKIQKSQQRINHILTSKQESKNIISR